MPTPFMWNQVAAPDFSTAIQGTGQAANLLTRAGQASTDAINAYQQADLLHQARAAQNTQNQAATWMLQRALQFSDPKALNQSFADSSFYQGMPADFTRQDIPASAVQQVGTMSGTLLNNARTAEDLSNSQFTNQRNHASILRNDATGNMIGQMVNATPEQMVGAYDAFNKYVSGLPPQEQLQARQAATAAWGPVAQAQLSNMVAGGMSPGAMSQQIYAAQNSGNTPPELLDAMKAAFTKVTGVPFEKQGFDVGTIGSVDPNAINGEQGTSSVVDTSTHYTIGDKTYDGNSIYGGTKYSEGLKPPTSLNLGQVMDQGTTLIGRTKGKLDGTTDGTSAQGDYQITNRTLSEFGPKVFGDSWKDIPFTPENQEKIAKRIWEDTPKTDKALQGRWTGLKGMSVSKMSWDEIKPLILSKEATAVSAPNPTAAPGEGYFSAGASQINKGSMPALSPEADVAARSALTNQINTAKGIGSDSSMPDYVKSLENSSKSKPTLVSELTAAGAPYEGEDPTYVNNAIEDIVNRSALIAKKMGLKEPLTNAQAATIMARQRTALNPTMLGSLGRGIASSFSGEATPKKWVPDTDKTNADIAKFLGNQAQGYDVAQKTLGSKQQQWEAAAKAKDELQAQFLQSKQSDLLKLGGKMSPTTREIQSKYQVASKRYFSLGKDLEDSLKSLKGNKGNAVEPSQSLIKAVKNAPMNEKDQQTLKNLALPNRLGYM